MKNRTMLPYFIMILPPLFWAGNFIVGRAVSYHGTPIGLSFWRWLLASLIFLPFAIKPIWQQKSIIKKFFWQIFVLALLAISAFNSLAYISLQYTTATNAILLNSFIPIFILIISGLFFGERIAPKQIAGVLISMFGVFAILTKLDLAIISSLQINRGDLWMLVAALDWALYSILLKHLRPKELGSGAFLGTIMIIGTVVLYPILLANPFQEQPMMWSLDIIQALLYIAIFPSILSYLAWNYGMQQIGASVGGQYLHLMPLFGALMATVFLGEHIQLYHLIGALSIGTGLWMSLSRDK